MTAMNRGLQKLGDFERKGLGGKKDKRRFYFLKLHRTGRAVHGQQLPHKIGVSKDVISLALGHEYGCKTTGIYIDYDLEK